MLSTSWPWVPIFVFTDRGDIVSRKRLPSLNDQQGLAYELVLNSRIPRTLSAHGSFMGGAM